MPFQNLLYFQPPPFSVPHEENQYMPDDDSICKIFEFLLN